MKVNYTNAVDSSILTYLSNNGLNLTFFLTQLELDICSSRFEALKKKCEEFQNTRSKMHLPRENITKEIRELQILQLDLISGIFMFLEEFLVYSYNLRKSITNFPYLMASRNDNTVKDEIEYLKKITSLQDVNRYLLLENVSKLVIGPVEKSFLEVKLNQISTEVLDALTKITEFYKRYYRVYVKFKHGLPALLGMYDSRYDTKIYTVGNQPARARIINSYILIRDIDKTTAKTYILPIGNIQFTYYQDMVDCLNKAFSKLLICYVNFFKIVNMLCKLYG